MKKYPEVITDEVLAQASLVTDEDIERDIRDTEVEVINLEKEVKGHDLIYQANRGNPSGKMAAFRRDGKRQGMDERRNFITFLRAVQDKRRTEIL